jgi:hypothetical protein
MGEPSFEIPPLEKAPDRRLDSWKEIAAYLARDVTTVQRWEKREGMPVHRHLHDKRGSVYALPEELDAWIQSRNLRADEPEKKPEAETPPIQSEQPRRNCRAEGSSMAGSGRWSWHLPLGRGLARIRPSRTCRNSYG